MPEPRGRYRRTRTPHGNSHPGASEPPLRRQHEAPPPFPTPPAVPPAENGSVDAAAANGMPPPPPLQGAGRTLHLFDLQVQSVPDLLKMADSYGLQDLGALRKHELIFEILKANGR
ncbi:MAG: Rho termination factor N-terminal domain-containing protein, partial [Verrucomicrobia bacterium]|nr:Rho termination factor N-terminal domain-containing protein [Verrucomicrobiota bacterium]